MNQPKGNNQDMEAINKKTTIKRTHAVLSLNFTANEWLNRRMYTYPHTKLRQKAFVYVRGYFSGFLIISDNYISSPHDSDSQAFIYI